MLIFYDNQSTLSDFCSNKTIKNISNFIFSKNIAILNENLFKDKYQFSNCEISNSWEYIYLTRFANNSQFDIINQLISQNIEIPDKLLCVAEEGTGFHGFRNRSWNAKKGNIHLTLHFKPQNTKPYFHAGLLIVAAVSVLQTIDSIPELTGLAKTKWVNDIVINNSKVCGIITQSFSSGNKISNAVIGIGLNVLSEPNIQNDIFTTSATTLKKESDQVNFTSVFQNLIANLETAIHLLESGKYLDLLNIYCQRSAVIGREVEIYSDHITNERNLLVSGKVSGINENLELILENQKSTVKSGRLAIKV